MKQRLADYVADFLVLHGISDIFSVVGGGAMHLNDALGHHEGLNVIYNHHEQACAIAAEAYARINNKMAAVCVTTGPGGTNALTGVVGGWLDSIPMMIISGQVRYDTTARYEYKVTGAVVRAEGDQEYDITKAAVAMTKYAVMIENPNMIKYSLEKAYHLATTGRPGPVWIDIPVNFQGTYIETSNLESYDPQDDDSKLPPVVSKEDILYVIDAVKMAKRPVIYAGYGIRLAGAYNEFRKVIEMLGIPVVTYWNSIDLIESDYPLYVGRGGNMGDRPGNYAVQNSDLLIAIGTRVSIRQVGYNWASWAREAKVIMVDIDRDEMKKHTLHVDRAIWADAKDFLINMIDALDREKMPLFVNQNGFDWTGICHKWKKKYPVVTSKQKGENNGYVNVYAFIDYLGRTLPDNSLTAVSNGACCVVGHQAYTIKKGTRFIINSAIASMGYGLPAAIGVCVSSGGKKTVCLEGDGSIMMNLQELQTVITNKYPIKIFLVNNNGYHSIRITQNNLFSNHSKVGIGPESADLGFPDYKKIAEAFGFPYFSAHTNDEMRIAVDSALVSDSYTFCEIFTDTQQVWEPKSSAKRLGDGSLVSPPLEDLSPFLPREEVLDNLYIKPVE